MELFRDKFFKRLTVNMGNPIYKNSIIIISTSIVSAVFGFVFWVLAAKIYSEKEIGIATALISSVSLLILFSRFGFDQSLIRFFPKGNKDKIYTSSVVVTTFLTILVGIFFIIFINKLYSNITIEHNDKIIFIIILVASSIASINSNSFIALREAKYYFISNILLGSRIIFLNSFIFFGAWGIFNSFGLSFILAFIFSSIAIYVLGIRASRLDKQFLSQSFKFSAGNYLATLLNSTPTLILPIMVLKMLGPEAAAYYYIPFSIASILFYIPFAFSTSLFVEGSHGESLIRTTLESICGVFLLLIPSVGIIYIWGAFILNTIGPSYINGLELLMILSFSSFFVAVYQTFLSIKKIQNDIKSLVLISTIICVLIIGLSYILMKDLGLIGIGISWIASYAVASVISLIMIFKANGTALIDWLRKLSDII